MAKLQDKAYFDFSGGVKRDKSPYHLKDNELQRGRNFEIDELGRIRKRRGSYQFGQNIAGLPLRIHHPPNGFYVANNATSPAVVYRLSSGRLGTALTTSSTTVVLTTTPSPDFVTTAEVIEIEGDLINYESYTTGTFSTVTNITSSHAVGASVNQWRSIGTLTASDGEDGAWFAYLNGFTFVLFNNTTTGGTHYWQINSSGTASAVSNEPAGMFLEVFRDRIFMVGNGVNSTYPTNRVFFSNLGDGTSWPSTAADNSFDLEDKTGEPNSGLKQYRQNLIIFKPSSFYAFSGSLPVRQISAEYGIHNDNCIQEINGLLYGFGPNGIFATNGITVKDIGQPVEEYYQDTKFGIIASGSEVQTLFTSQWERKFIVYIGDATTIETINDLMLIYDTKKQSWEVWSGWTDPTTFNYLKRYRTDNRNQQRNVLFWGASTKVYRAFEDRHTEVDGSGVPTTRGTDIYSDLFSNTGSAITMNVLTKPYDLGAPHIRKFPAYLKVYSEIPGYDLSLVVDEGDPIPLGKISDKIQRIKMPSKAKGFRFALNIDESSTNPSVICNGFVFEDITLIDKNTNA